MVNYTAFVRDNPLPVVVEKMNKIFSDMDIVILKHKVDKVETIGDAYFVVSADVTSIMDTARALVASLGDTIRIGIHCGEVRQVSNSFYDVCCCCCSGANKFIFPYFIIMLGGSLYNRHLQGQTYVYWPCSQLCCQIGGNWN